MVYNNVKAIRSSRKMSQRELAEAAGIGITQVNRIENGAINSVTLSTMCKLAAALEIEPTKLFFEKLF